MSSIRLFLSAETFKKTDQRMLLISVIVLLSSTSVYTLSSSYRHHALISFRLRDHFFKNGQTNSTDISNYSVLNLAKNILGKIDWRDTFMKMLRMIVDEIVTIIFNMIFDAPKNRASRRFAESAKTAKYDKIFQERYYLSELFLKNIIYFIKLCIK